MAAANPAAGAIPGALAPALSRPGWLGLDYKWLVLIAMLPGFTVFLLDVTIVNVALARLGSVFDVNYATVQWVITGYSLASGMATPMASFMERPFHDEADLGDRARDIYRLIRGVRHRARVLGPRRR